MLKAKIRLGLHCRVPDLVYKIGKGELRLLNGSLRNSDYSSIKRHNSTTEKVLKVQNHLLPGNLSY